MEERQLGERHLERWIVLLAIIALCCSAFWITMSFDRMPPILKRGIQPSDFPQLVSVLIIALAVLMAWRDPVTVRSHLGRTTWGTLALMAVFAALTTLDLILALAAFAAALAVLWGERRPVLLATVGIAVPAVVFFLFDQVFEIRFPRGILTSLWYG